MYRSIAIMVALVTVASGAPAIAVNWGEFKADSCTKLGHRQHSAVLWGIPWGASWEKTCEETPADVMGVHFDKPSRCVNTNLNMWGEFDVPDASCSPHWEAPKDDGCAYVSVRQFSAILGGIPVGASWEEACSTTPNTIAGQPFAKPSRCVSTLLNMWGEFDVADASCVPRWDGAFSKTGCPQDGVARYEGRLVDVPAKVSPKALCDGTPVTINGKTFSHPDSCVETAYPRGANAVVLVDDPTCKAEPSETAASCPQSTGWVSAVVFKSVASTDTLHVWMTDLTDNKRNYLGMLQPGALIAAPLSEHHIYGWVVISEKYVAEYNKTHKTNIRGDKESDVWPSGLLLSNIVKSQANLALCGYDLSDAVVAYVGDEAPGRERPRQPFVLRDLPPTLSPALKRKLTLNSKEAEKALKAPTSGVRQPKQ